jgi:hypothetical protein
MKPTPGMLVVKHSGEMLVFPDGFGNSSSYKRVNMGKQHCMFLIIAFKWPVGKLPDSSRIHWGWFYVLTSSGQLVWIAEYFEDLFEVV